jgi:hypothetical protein
MLPPLLISCRKSSGQLDGEPLPEVLLRFTPQVGQTYRYACFINLDKKTFGNWRNEKVDAIISLTIFGKDGDRYHIKYDAQSFDSNISEEDLASVKDKPEKLESYEINASDRYIFDAHLQTSNLCFPDRPVKPGTQWEGEALFTFGDLATINAPMERISYKLIEAVRTERGRYCLIECKLVAKEVKVPLQIGQLGFKCDTEGKVIAIREDSDAQNKIEVGDILIAVNGHKAVIARDRGELYEKFVEPTGNIGALVRLSIVRDDKEQNVEVEKSFVTIGIMHINIKKGVRKVLFGIDKGIVVSDESSPIFSVVYEFPIELPFLDDYTGTEPLKRVMKRKIPPRIYKYEWKMKLIQQEK